MNHQDVKDAMLVDRYLAGNLSARELETFETHYLSCEECLAELELTEKLRCGARDTEDSATGDGSEAPVSRAARLEKTVVRTRYYATAASVLFAMSIIVSGRLYRELGMADPVAGAQIVPIHATRGTASRPANIVHLRSETTTTTLIVDPGPTPLADYRVGILRVTNGGYEQVTLLEGLQLTYEQMVAVSIPGAALESGNYLLSLDGRAQSEQEYRPVTELSFSVEVD